MQKHTRMHETQPKAIRRQQQKTAWHSQTLGRLSISRLQPPQQLINQTVPNDARPVASCTSRKQAPPGGRSGRSEAQKSARHRQLDPSWCVNVRFRLARSLAQAQAHMTRRKSQVQRNDTHEHAQHDATRTIVKIRDAAAGGHGVPRGRPATSDDQRDMWKWFSCGARRE